MAIKTNYKDYPILIIDDDESLLISLGAALKKDFEVYTANNAKEAWDIIKGNNIAVVLSDQRMPDVTGSQLLAEIKVKYPDIIRLLITGYADLADAIKAINEGKIFGYIKKQMSENERNVIIRSSVEHFALSRDNESLRERLRYQEQLKGFYHIIQYMGDFVNTKLINVKSLVEKLDKSIGTLVKQYPETETHISQDQILSEDFKEIAKSLDGAVGILKDVGNSLYIASKDSLTGDRENIKNLIDYTKEDIQPHLDKYKMKLKCNVSADLPPIQSPAHLKFALTELIYNAIRNTPQGGEIDLNVQKQKIDNRDFCQIEVCDNGMGIKKEHLDVITKEPFTTDVDRPGVGLMSVAHIARLYNGSIDINSEEGKGTKVTLQLPIYLD